MILGLEGVAVFGDIVIEVVEIVFNLLVIIRSLKV